MSDPTKKHSAKGVVKAPLAHSAPKNHLILVVLIIWGGIIALIALILAMVPAVLTVSAYLHGSVTIETLEKTCMEASKVLAPTGAAPLLFAAYKAWSDRNHSGSDI